MVNGSRRPPDVAVSAVLTVARGWAERQGVQPSSGRCMQGGLDGGWMEVGWGLDGGGLPC